MDGLGTRSTASPIFGAPTRRAAVIHRNASEIRKTDEKMAFQLDSFVYDTLSGAKGVSVERNDR
jgi:hypothetical protein